MCVGLPNEIPEKPNLAKLVNCCVSVYVFVIRDYRRFVRTMRMSGGTRKELMECVFCVRLKITDLLNRLWRERSRTDAT